MNKIRLPFFAAILFFAASTNAQDSIGFKKVYTLKEIINVARNQSIASKQAETTKENRYWQFQSYKSNYKPQLNLDGTLPGFTNSYQGVSQPDGSTEYLQLQQNSSELNLRISQDIGPTGTRLFLNSGIFRFDNYFQESILCHFKAYMKMKR